MEEMNIHIKLKRQKEKQSEDFYRCDAADGSFILHLTEYYKCKTGFSALKNIHRSIFHSFYLRQTPALGNVKRRAVKVQWQSALFCIQYNERRACCMQRSCSSVSKR